MQSEISYRECAVTNTKNMTNENLVFPKSSSTVQKCCVFVGKLTAAKLLRTWNSAADASTSKYWSRTLMVLQKSIAKFLMRDWNLHLQTEVSEQKITQLQLMNKLNEDYHFFIPEEWQKTMDITHNHWTCNFHFQSVILCMVFDAFIYNLLKLD